MSFHNQRCAVLLFVGLTLFGLGIAPLAHAAPPVGGSNYNLDRLIAEAIQNHPSIAAARAQLGAAQAEVGAARSQYFPTPSFQLQQDKGATATVLALQQPLWAGGRIDAGMDAAQSRANAAQESIGGTQYTLAQRVTSAWAGWAQARGRGEALDKGVALLNVYAEVVSRRIQGGASGEVDRELVAARLAQTQSDLGAARSAERNALARLAQMTGQPLRLQDLGAPEASVAIDLPLPALDQLVTQALSRSSALKRLEANIETAQHEVEQKRAALWPALNLRAQHQRNDGSVNGITGNDSRLMLVLDYAPGAGLAASANIDAAVAGLRAQRESLDAARRDLTETVISDYEEHQACSDRKPHLQRSIKASVEVLASYDRLFIAGRRNWLDVINAARELIQAQTALADLESQQIAARARLRLHLGEML